ncbi:MAG: hypothetical protein CM1200mP2_39660 [Planctomycetaceae bacterium]|nr:MAG: hypothetical protein CM1200mP2_39660 [Planctomycetaceae bacterium]
MAPTLTTLCATCHRGRNGRGGFSLATFESLMRGSDSGRVVLPGNLDGSIIWRRVAALDKDKQKMPPGNRRITREFFNSLKTWIQEGAKFDGESATVAMRSLVPTDEDKKAEMLAKLSAEEFKTSGSSGLINSGNGFPTTTVLGSSRRRISSSTAMFRPPGCSSWPSGLTTTANTADDVR